ncbi:hypothetical protein HGG76_27160 [Ochrobactrum tritici]|uniref:Uncharacterized protein n=1 Tax=Brucella tritici TaxID=94626 RepID=A0A7X6JBU7_9HYPH|nr:hypothetical protein [Brucella tritici]
MSVIRESTWPEGPLSLSDDFARVDFFLIEYYTTVNSNYLFSIFVIKTSVWSVALPKAQTLPIYRAEPETISNTSVAFITSSLSNNFRSIVVGQADVLSPNATLLIVAFSRLLPMSHRRGFSDFHPGCVGKKCFSLGLFFLSL